MDSLRRVCGSEFYIIYKSEHCCCKFYMQIVGVGLYDPGPRHGLNDPTQSLKRLSMSHGVAQRFNPVAGILAQA